MHRVGGGATGPQHVRGVQHDGQRAGRVGTNLQAGGDRRRRGARGERVVDGGLSNRSSSSPTGSSTRVMPATAAVPGMTQT